MLDGLESEECAFRKGTLIAIRQRLMGSKMDHRLIERTIEVASQSAGIDSHALRVALDSSPLCGVSRVEDTYNFLRTRSRQRQLTVAGQARLREHVAVEHALTHVGQEQRGGARYRGIRKKNFFDLRCCAVVHNQHVLVMNEPSHAA